MLSSFLAIAIKRRDSLSSSRVFRPRLQKLEFPRALKTCPEERVLHAPLRSSSSFWKTVRGSLSRFLRALPVIASGTAELRQSELPRDELKAYVPRVCSCSPLLRTSLSERYGVHSSVCPPSPFACPPDSPHVKADFSAATSIGFQDRGRDLSVDTPSPRQLAPRCTAAHSSVSFSAVYSYGAPLKQISRGTR